MSKALSALRTGVRLWLQESTAKSHSEDQLTLALNTVARAAQAELAALPETGWCVEKSTPVDIEADEPEYDVPTGMTNWKAVEIYDGSKYVPLDPLRAVESHRAEYTSILDLLDTTSGALPRAFERLADSIVLRPTPTAAISDGLRFVGVVEYEDMSGDSDTTGLPALLDAAIEFGAAALLMLAEGNELGAHFQGLHKSEKETALGLLARRDEMPRHMHDAGHY